MLNLHSPASGICSTACPQHGEAINEAVAAQGRVGGKNTHCPSLTQGPALQVKPGHGSKGRPFTALCIRCAHSGIALSVHTGEQQAFLTSHPHILRCAPSQRPACQRTPYDGPDTH